MGNSVIDFGLPFSVKSSPNPQFHMESLVLAPCPMPGGLQVLGTSQDLNVCLVFIGPRARFMALGVWFMLPLTSETVFPFCFTDRSNKMWSAVIALYLF